MVEEVATKPAGLWLLCRILPGTMQDAQLPPDDLLRRRCVLGDFDTQRQIIDRHLLDLRLDLVLHHMAELADQDRAQSQVLDVG